MMTDPIADLLTRKTGETPKFLVSGGIQHSPSAMQRLADVLNHPVYANPEPEASIRGAAVFAMEKLRLPIAPLPVGLPFRPRKAPAQRYQEARGKLEALERLLVKNGC